jgi:hypothetical protein
LTACNLQESHIDVDFSCSDDLHLLGGSATRPSRPGKLLKYFWFAPAVLLACACWRAQAQTPQQPAAPTPEQVHQSVERVRADPLLSHTEIRKTLRLKKRNSPKKPASADDETSYGLQWLLAFAAWVAQTLRLAIWVLGALAAAWLLLGLRRWLRVRGPVRPGVHAPPPSHVQSLDIRPESLPSDIGAAAARLWQRGEQRAALSLLYRGALSRLVHAHALPIRAASTEGECLALASQRLDAPRAAFFARLVGVWLPAVYGARMPEAQQALGLCHEFDAHLAPEAPGGGTR